MDDQSSDEANDLRIRISSSNSEEDGDYGEFKNDSDGSEGYEQSERETGTESENEIDTAESPNQPSSSEWIEFNQKVVSMRPLFKSVKVQFIHKASRTIKILRKKKGTPEQIKSNNKKADRLVQEIGYINRLKKDVIAKFALLHSKEEVIKIVNTADSSMEYRVKAKVASMARISKAAEDYHLKHPEWRESLFKLIQLAGKNMKKKRRKVRGKSNKGSKINEDNRQNAKRQQSKNSKTREDDVDSERFGVSNFPEPPPGLDDLMGGIGNSNEENLNSGTGSEEEDDADAEDQPFHEYDREPTSEEVGLILRTSTSKTEKALPRNNFGKSVTKKAIDLNKKQAPVSEGSSKVNSDKNVMRNSEERLQDMKCITLSNGSKMKRLYSGDSSDSEGEGNEIGSKHEANIDPFFMTSDNKEYKTLWKVEPADSFKNRNPKEPEFMFKNARPFKDVLSGKNKKGLSKAKVPRADRNERKAGGKGQLSEVSVEKLHPSWQAKKKMSVVAFQGKKVVFDDD